RKRIRLFTNADYYEEDSTKYIGLTVCLADGQSCGKVTGIRPVAGWYIRWCQPYIGYLPRRYGASQYRLCGRVIRRSLFSRWQFRYRYRRTPFAASALGW